MYRNIIAGVFSAAILWVAYAWEINQLSIARLHDHRVEVETSARRRRAANRDFEGRGSVDRIMSRCNLLA